MSVEVPELRDSATTVRLVLKYGHSPKIHKGASAELRDKHKVKKKRTAQVRVDPFECEALDNAKKLGAQLRQEHKDMTLSWHDPERLLVNTMASQYDRVITELDGQIRSNMETFFLSLPQLKQNWFMNGGGLAANGTFVDKHGNDTGIRWPSEDEARSKFVLDVIPGTVNEVGDLRFTGLPEDMRDRFKKDIIAAENRRVSNTVRDVSDRVSNVLNRVIDRMREYGKDENGKVKGKFTHTLIPNVREIAELLEHFNITNDPHVEEVRRRLVTEICQVDQGKLRDDAELRENLGNTAEDILARVSAFGSKPNND